MPPVGDKEPNREESYADNHYNMRTVGWDQRRLCTSCKGTYVDTHTMVGHYGASLYLTIYAPAIPPARLNAVVATSELLFH
jgi:hypothetical protein